MIIRVTIHCEAINLHSCEIYTDEETALRSTDRILDKYELNDGCTLGSEEDFPALNMMLAEKFEDAQNIENYAKWENITADVVIRCADNFCEHVWDSDKLKELAEQEFGFDLTDDTMFNEF